MKRQWRIRGYEGLKVFFDVSVPFGSMTETQLKAALKCLAATAGGLRPGEVIGAYARRKTKIANDLLTVTKNGPYLEYSCGSNPYFIAICADEQGRRTSHQLLP